MWCPGDFSAQFPKPLRVRVKECIWRGIGHGAIIIILSCLLGYRLIDTTKETVKGNNYYCISILHNRCNTISPSIENIVTTMKSLSDSIPIRLNDKMAYLFKKRCYGVNSSHLTSEFSNFSSLTCRWVVKLTHTWFALPHMVYGSRSAEWQIPLAKLFLANWRWLGSCNRSWGECTRCRDGRSTSWCRCPRAVGPTPAWTWRRRAWGWREWGFYVTQAYSKEASLGQVNSNFKST